MSDGKDERFRLRFLIKRCGKYIFKYRVEEEIKAPHTLEEILSDPDNKQKLICLNEKHVITQEQFHMLYPDSGSPSVTDFDLTLWLVLLRTFFCSKPYTHPVWYKSNKPDDADLSVEADIVRIRDYKNEIKDYAEGTLTEENFKKSWDGLSEIFLRVGTGINGLANMIEEVKKMKFDIEKDEEVVKDFSTWAKMEEMFEQGLDLSICESKIYGLKLYSLLVDGGTRVFRNVLDDRIPPTCLKARLNTNHWRVVEMRLKEIKVINDSQEKLLYPSTGEPSSENFDMTLLVILLRNLCGFDQTLQVWNTKGQPPAADTSPEADIVRIREYRNKTCHLTKVSGMTKDEFENTWDAISKAFLRLDNTCGENKLPHLQNEIDKLKSNNIDPTREEELQRILDECIKMDEIMESIIINTILANSPSVTAIEHSREIVGDVLANQYFVKTEQFEEAKRKLKENYIIVLNGAPGEGKTTLAMELLLDVFEDKRYILLNSYSDWARVKVDSVDAILIDDMFGSGIFDKEEHRKWQKHIPSIDAAVKNKRLYVVITSRSYILTEAVEKMIMKSIFTTENIVTLSSNKLLQSEKQEILQNHFSKACDKNEKIKKLISKGEHEGLVREITELKIESMTAPSSIGFPECARLFANNDGLYKEGVDFFINPMVSVRTYISVLLNDDDTFVAFFVLWAQNTKTLSSLELELPVYDTTEKITDPILSLQFRPKDHIRKIRDIFQKHRGGFIHFDSTNELFSFSHRVVRDAVGLVSYEKNTTATISFCDSTFIENFIRIRTQSFELCVNNEQQTVCNGKEEDIVSVAAEFESSILSESTISLTVARYGQLILKIGEIAGGSISLSSLESLYLDSSIFMCKIFEEKEFCMRFFDVMKEKNMLRKLLMMPVRTIDREFAEFKFLKMRNSKMRLPSYLVWIKEKICPLSDACFKAICSLESGEKEQELSMAMLISTKLGHSALIDYFLRIGGEININMMSLALYTDNQELFDKFLSIFGIEKLSFLFLICQRGYDEIVSKLVQIGVNVWQPDEARLYPIHHAINGGHVGTVSVLLEHDTSIAKELGLLHLAVRNQNPKIIDTLLLKGISPTQCDEKGRTPFLLAIHLKAKHLLFKLLDIAIEGDVQCRPDKYKNTPLYVSVVNAVDRNTQQEDRKVLIHLAQVLCRFDENLHLVNNNRDTPLKFACKHNLVGIVNEIIKHEDPYRNQGSTIFHQFVLDGDRNSIETLLKSNINPNEHDRYHRTPFMLANVMGKTLIVEQLQSDPKISSYNKKIGIPLVEINHSQL